MEINKYTRVTILNQIVMLVHTFSITRKFLFIYHHCILNGGINLNPLDAQRLEYSNKGIVPIQELLATISTEMAGDI